MKFKEKLKEERLDEIQMASSAQIAKNIERAIKLLEEAGVSKKNKAIGLLENSVKLLKQNKI